MRLPLAPRTRAIAVLTAIAAAAVLTITIAGTDALASEGTVLGADQPNAVPGEYIVVLRDSSMDATTVRNKASSLTSKHSGRMNHVYSKALHGFSATLSPKEARRLAADPAVAYVEQDTRVTAFGTQTPTPSFGLDRVDQRNQPLNNSYTFPNTAANVHAYIIDTGIRLSHTDFGGRAVSGFDAVDGGSADDCNGHGTHVAGTVGGRSFGLAKAVQLVAVRVLDCQGSGTNAQVIAGVDWVTANSIKPAVANMSLGGGANTALDNAVGNSIASGVTYALAAGNAGASACTSSPARVPAAITVGATTSTDARASFSNIGTCVDLFAPGSAITSDWLSSDTATNTLSGTSMASPHAAGAAALVLAANPTFTPAQVRDKLVADATAGVISGAGTGSPNLLLFVNNSTTTPPPSAGSTVFADDFDTVKGWTANPGGTDTATTGTWERGAADATTSGINLQLGVGASGTNNLVTGRLGGADAGVNDVDGGVTSVQSPVIALPTSATLTLRFSWYLAHLANATGADFFRVSVISPAGTTVVLNQTGSAAQRAGAWTAASADLTPFAGQSIRIRVEAADAATPSLIEAGLDNLTITRS